MGFRYLQFKLDALHRLDERHLLRYTITLIRHVSLSIILSKTEVWCAAYVIIILQSIKKVKVK